MKSGMIENWEGMEKWKDIGDFSFPFILFDWNSEKVEGWKTHLFG